MRCINSANPMVAVSVFAAVFVLWQPAARAECPDGYPVDCGDGYCCPSGTTCAGNGQCESGGGGGGGTCPDGYPVNCGDGTCCPSGTTC
ncbi:MAG: hypothetical protein GY854_27040, partial [Deltaproteobacteria bacterium]|nr:hypothetical protein [Deltaproteobacteria bacterium]